MNQFCFKFSSILVVFRYHVSCLLVCWFVFLAVYVEFCLFSLFFFFSFFKYVYKFSHQMIYLYLLHSDAVSIVKNIVQSRFSLNESLYIYIICYVCSCVVLIYMLSFVFLIQMWLYECGYVFKISIFLY